MRVPRHVVEERRQRLAGLLERHTYLPVSELCRILGVSEATARRDLSELERQNKIKRTHGGAFAEFNDRFPSFNQRQTRGSEAKQVIARLALEWIQPGGIYFLDSGTTIYCLAEAFRRNPRAGVRFVTSNLPAGEMLAAVPDVEVFQVAGQILSRQSVLLGEAACRSLEFWNFDTAFVSAEAANEKGIFNTQQAIVQQQLVAIRRSARTAFCLDSGKIGRSAPFPLVPWSDVDILITDASPARLEKAGVPKDKIAPPPATAPAEDSRPQLPVHFL
ncbi:MAG: DeoR/GlpR family DNA-binding transcription regulator [Terrimicrobiaceae bacterium]|nr:DeoR/GlpR family DNA-binding transcription regulator [Terrimicrobiaceae bacterium]